MAPLPPPVAGPWLGRYWSSFSQEGSHPTGLSVKGIVDLGVGERAPLPLLGAAAAFGHSRKLRKCINGEESRQLVDSIN